jgi:fatty acid desaturase
MIGLKPPAQQARRARRARSGAMGVAQRLQWPTLGLVVVIHGGWLAATFWSDRLPLAALIAVGGWLIAWRGSLQHEIIHGHPTRWRRLNDALAAAPLGLWLPFEAYRRAHIDHHASDALTDPNHDPESRYLRAGGGLDYRARHGLAELQASLLGRLTLGPIVEIIGFLIGQAGAAMATRRGCARRGSCTA